MKNIKPLGNRVLVKRSKTSQSKGGILLPDSAKEKPKEGEIIAVGPGRVNEEGKKESMHVKEGDRVLFSAYAGTEVKLSLAASEDDELLIMSEEDLLGILQQ